MTTAAANLTFSAIIAQALTEPGILSKAYSAFHNFSLGNQILAAIQLGERGLPLSPIASFNNWKEKGRFVKKSEKAIKLFMPVTIKRKAADEATGEEIDAGSFQAFMLKPHWFSLDQTEGDDYAPEAKTPAWDAEKAMQALDIEETRFDDLRGAKRAGKASGSHRAGGAALAGRFINHANENNSQMQTIRASESFSIVAGPDPRLVDPHRERGRRFVGRRAQGAAVVDIEAGHDHRPGVEGCLLYTSPSPRDGLLSRMPSSA